MRSRSASQASRSLPQTVTVGRVLRPHGVRGELKIEVESDVAGRFAPGRELRLVLPGAPVKTVRVAGYRPHAGGALLRLQGCGSRDEAETLRGGVLEVPRREVPEAPPGAYYHYELLGCRCFDAAGEELGEVVELLEDGGGTLLRVESGGRSLLVPLARPFLAAVEIEERRIELRLPPGLVEACASRS